MGVREKPLPLLNPPSPRAVAGIATQKSPIVGVPLTLALSQREREKSRPRRGVSNEWRSPAYRCRPNQATASRIPISWRAGLQNL